MPRHRGPSFNNEGQLVVYICRNCGRFMPFEDLHALYGCNLQNCADQDILITALSEWQNVLGVLPISEVDLRISRFLENEMQHFCICVTFKNES